MGRLGVARRWCADNFSYYVIFRKSILFILGLIFSYKLLENLIFNILITYITPPSEDYNMQKAAIVVNLQGGICSFLTIILAFVADAYVGPFKMLVSSSIFCITGLVVTHFAAKKYDDNFDEFLNMFYPALVLLTLSQAATLLTLESFLYDQLVLVRNQPATVEEENRTEKRTEFWWYFVSFFASIFVLFGPLKNFSLMGITRVLAIVLGASSFWFLLGFKFDNRVKPTGSALSDVPIVLCSAIIKRNVAYPQSSEQLYQNSKGDVQILPHTSWLRWLDKAAVVHENLMYCSVEQVKGVKYLLKMLPMWSMFITFSLVYASGDTFFLEEASSITDASFPLLLLITLQRITEVVVSKISDYVLEKLHEKMNFNAQKMMLVRIGIGMLCCVLCCITAWTQAVHRLEAKGNMSVYWLTPQFLLLAIMGGLSSDGLQNFFESQVSRSMFRYGRPFQECVNGIGRFVSIVFILILSKWFKNGAESSRLDKYYALLAILSSVNIIAYCLVARWYGDETFVVKDDHNIHSALQIVVIGGEEQRESSARGGEEKSESSPLGGAEKNESSPTVGEEKSESSPLLRGGQSFPSPSVNRGVYSRFRSMPR